MPSNLLSLFVFCAALLREAVSCHATCATCVPTTSTQSSDCASCATGAELSHGSAPSPCQCASGYYPNPDASNCSACDYHCATCTGGTSADCITCSVNSSPVAATPGTCVCNSNMLDDAVAGACVAQGCSPLCAFCTSPASTDCTSCVANASGPPCICSPTGYWTSTVTNSCELCYYLCSGCSGPAANECSSCNDGNAGVSGGACVCNTQYYPNPDANSCASCHNYCKACIGPGSNQCTSCKSAASLPSTISVGTCTCNPGFYPAPDVSNCFNCDGTCSTCTGPSLSQCTSCRTAAYLVAPAPSECACLVGYVASNTSGNCIKCDNDCATCSGSSQGSCLTCGSNAHLRSSTPTYCDCDSGYGRNPDSMHCNPCHQSCLLCVDATASGCTSCKTLAHLSALAPTSCACDNGRFASPDASNCLPCDPSCATCNAGTSADCLSCKSNAQLTSSPGPSTCVCNSGFYGAPDASNCVSCSPTCGSCTLTSPLSCSGCKAGAVLAGGVCSCAAGYFASPDASNCVLCNPNCASCGSTSTGGCLSCAPSAELVGGKTPGSCACSSGFYPNPDATHCASCSPTCATCSGSGSCSTCRSGAVGNGSGVCTCNSIGYYPSPDASNCAPCDKTCLTCTGASASVCTTCYKLAVLSSTAPSSCVCMSGYFPMPHTGACRCDYSCATCADTTSSGCLSCSPNAHMKSIPGPAQCACDDAFFPNPLPSACTECHYSCATCSGPGDTDCLSCGLLAKMAGTPPSSCSCGEGFGMFGRNCVQCYELCASCRGTTANSCSSCKSPLQLVGTESISSCDCAPYSYLSSRSPLECSKCHEKCYTCSDFSTCIACNPAYYWYKGDCYKQCPGNAQVMGNECRDCFHGCASCSGALSTECLSCLDGFHLTTLHSCYECPVGEFYVADSECASCSATCFMCSGTDSCETCGSPTLALVAGQCVASTCPLLCTDCSGQQCTACTSDAEMTAGACVCSSGFTQVGRLCLPAYQDCVGFVSVNATDVVLRTGFAISEADVRIQLFDLSTSAVVEANFTVSLLNHTDSAFYSDLVLAYDDSTLTSSTQILLKFTHQQDCASPYDKYRRGDLVTAFPIVKKDSWGLSAMLRNFARIPQYFVLAGFFVVAVTGRRRAFWSLYSVLFLISYQGLMDTRLNSDTKKFMLTVSRLTLLPNFFNLIIGETATESADSADLSRYGISQADILSSTLLVHAGTFVSLGLVLLALFPAGKVLVRMRGEKTRQFGRYLVRNFKFNFFFRYAIEHYLIFAYSSLQQLKNFSIASVGSAISSLLAVVCVVRDTQTAVHAFPGLLGWFYFKNRLNIKLDDFELSPFRTKWSTLLGDFRCHSYYFLGFLTRRLVLAYSIVFASSSLVQTTANAVAAAAVSRYLSSQLSQ